MILVDIYAPAVDKTFDFKLDENAEVSLILGEVTAMIAKKTGSESPGSADDFLIYKSGREQPLSVDLSLFENGIRDGDRLIIV